jgi:hypothetical protein
MHEALSSISTSQKEKKDAIILRLITQDFIEKGIEFKSRC